MADVAAAFHWPLRDLDQMPLNELIDWQWRAVQHLARPLPVVLVEPPKE